MNKGFRPSGNAYSTWQLTTIITSTLIGVGVLTLPRSASIALGEAGWISTIAGGLISMGSCWLMARLSRLFPGRSLVEYSPLVLGSSSLKWLGKVISFPLVLCYLAYLYIIAAFASRLFGEVVVTAVLMETPLEATIIAMFLLAAVLCQHDPQVVARINELLFPLIILPLLLLAVASFQKAEWNNLLPIFTFSWKDLFNGVMETTFSFEGYEVMFIFFAFAQGGAGKGTASVAGLGIAMLVYTLIVIAGIAVFDIDELQLLMWPTLELVKTTQVPGLILERLESAFLAVWVVAVFTTIGNVYYAFIYGLRQLLGKGIVFQRISSVLLLIPLFWLALQPQNLLELSRFNSIIGYAGAVFFGFYPIFYLFLSLLRGRKLHRQAGEQDD
ncbi:MAG: endospore germination permease [Brevibacillus sp.]|nr:endospore germination permease [Brevibacillus sp.]